MKLHQQWIKEARTFCYAFRFAIGVVSPRLPMRGFGVAVLQNGAVITVDYLGDAKVDRVNPGAVFGEQRGKLLWRGLWDPFLRWARLARLTVVMRRQIKNNLAGYPAPEFSNKTIQAIL